MNSTGLQYMHPGQEIHLSSTSYKLVWCPSHLKIISEGDLGLLLPVGSGVGVCWSNTLATAPYSCQLP